jgi:hypothetical protein
MRYCLALVMILVSLVNSQTLSLQAPAPGATFHQNDTIYFDFSGDSLYMTNRVKVVLEILVPFSGSYYVQLHPSNISSLGNNAIFTSDSFWGHVPVVVPDSVKYNKFPPAFWRSTVSDSIRFRVRDYSIDSINAQSGFVKILPCSTCAANISSTMNAQGPRCHRIRIINGVMESDIPMVSVKLFTLNGRFVGNVGSDRKKIVEMPEKFMNPSGYIVQSIFVDNTGSVVFFVNTR